jgi:hypothetical protein
VFIPNFSTLEKKCVVVINLFLTPNSTSKNKNWVAKLQMDFVELGHMFQVFPSFW